MDNWTLFLVTAGAVSLTRSLFHLIDRIEGVRK